MLLVGVIALEVLKVITHFSKILIDIIHSTVVTEKKKIKYSP